MGVKFNKQNYFKEKKKGKKQLQKPNSCDADGMENFPFGNHNYYFKNPKLFWKIWEVWTQTP